MIILFHSVFSFVFPLRGHENDFNNQYNIKQISENIKQTVNNCNYSYYNALYNMYQVKNSRSIKLRENTDYEYMEFADI